MSATGRLGASELGAAWAGILSEIGEIQPVTIWLKKWDPKMDWNGDVNRENDDNPINLGVYYFEIFWDKTMYLQ